jgi:hypothetical protein
MSYGVGLRNGVAFALGTIPSLTSGGGLRPSLLLNFLSGTLDSRITFSRGTQATQYTSNGTLQYAPNNLLTYSNQADNAAWTKSNSFVQTNLLTYSEQFDNAAWNKLAGGTGIVPAVTANYALAPDGTLTADRIVFDRGAGTSSTDVSYIQQTVTSVSADCTGSFYLRTTDGSTKNITLRVGGTFNFAVSVTGTWTRVSLTGTSPITRIDILAYGDRGPQVIDLLVWGAQLVQGSVPGNYVATTSAALPVLYADYNGVVRARKLCESSANSTHSVSQGITTTATPYTFSVYAKQPSDGSARRYFLVYHSQSNSGWVFDLQTGTLGVGGTTGVSAPVSYAITSIGNGWYRCQITVNATAASNSFLHYLVDNNGSGGSVYTGDGSSGIYIADAQLEAGSTVQAYNDTTSAAYYGPRFDYDPTNLVRQNLLLQSNDFLTSWTPANITRTLASTTGPDGTLSGVKIEATAAVTTELYQDQAVAATSATASVYVKQGTGATAANAFGIRNVSTATNLIIGTFNYSTGVFTYTVGSTGVTVTNAGNGYWRLQISATSGITSGNIIRFYVGYLGATPAAGDFLYAYGAQLNTGSTALTYTATTTAPYTLVAAKGLLIEEQRANLLLQSNDFQTSWSPTNITRTLASTTGPDGTLSGVKLEATATVGTNLYQAAVVNATSATGSIYVKQGTSATVGNTFILRNNTTATNLIGGTFNYSTGVFTYSVGSTGVVVTNVGNGWWRVVITATTGITSGDTMLWYAGWSGAVATAGDFFYAYGAQLEVGAFATSYIPTVGSQVTRSADSASITTLTPWFNPTEGAIFLEYVATADPAGTYRTQVKIVDGGGTNYLQLRNQNPSATTATTNNQVVAASVTQVDITSASLSASAIIKTALAYKVNDFAAATNGAAPITDASGSVPTGLTTMSFGGGAFAAGQTWYRNLSDYPTRLPNATLQGLTV